jgi:hypothetical protein
MGDNLELEDFGYCGRARKMLKKGLREGSGVGAQQRRILESKVSSNGRQRQSEEKVRFCVEEPGKCGVS